VKIVSTDGTPGIIGVGQEAQGIVAFGQFARGFVAVGQVAIGFVAIGQLSVTVVGVGQGGIGIGWFAGMLGVGGRGVCLRLIPGLDPPRVAPETVPFETVLHGAPGVDGYVRVEVIDTPGGARLALGGQPLPVKPTPEIAVALTNARRTHAIREVFAHVRRAGVTLVCDRLVEIPGTRRAFGLGLAVVRVLLLIGLATGFWYAFLGIDV
jgi:hypothetical protein